MRVPLSACLLFLSATLLRADEPRWISLDGQPVPPPKSSYKADWQTQVVVPGEAPCLQILPAATRPAKGTVLVAPGGGYETLSATKEGSNLAAPLNAAGYDAVVLVYTVGKKEDKDRVKAQALGEAKRALALIRTRGAEFGLSTAQVGAMGFSAGGHLVLRLAHETADAAPPDFLVAMYPGGLEKDGALRTDVMPPKGPVFVCVGDLDHLLADAALLDGYCRAHALPCTYVVLPGVGHGFGLTDNLPAGAKDWPAKFGAFLATIPVPAAATTTTTAKEAVAP